MNKGAYCLIIKLDNDKDIKINKRTQFFKKGYYCYVGSALNNLDKRIERHKSQEKKMHWHIDYFLKHANIIDVKRFISDEKIECGLADKVNTISDDSIKGFGCSDCNCDSHLFLIKSKSYVTNIKI
jgi:Uri superfamily endonuclease